VLIFITYESCFQDTVFQDPSHLYYYPTKKCVHFNVTLLQKAYHVKKKNPQLIRFYPLMMVPCRPKHLGMVNMIL